MTARFEAEPWLAVMIGNSRWHCAAFAGTRLLTTWERPQRTEWVGDRLPADLRLASWRDHREAPPVYLGSVVPAQTALWQTYPNLTALTLADIPLGQSYPGLGIDRALALYGAGQIHGWPVLVIDAGTALTFTGGDRGGNLVGGAILPGLGLQLRSLAQETAALGAIALPKDLPSLWSQETGAAIAAGTVHGLLATIMLFLTDWWRQFPGSPVILTGGDAPQLADYLGQADADLASRLRVDPLLVFRGMQQIRARRV
ncbi:MAG: pantothenate kinase [Spirulinaceae cyanobacterium RM2_2_10]|nr:pantothenate kinase [Spirulinaceae cyanobacterium SM2_1_0]NJO20350.1 pantothenate kinase [Spirulinaceae cyanobacterium RM2_2_10]